MKQKTVASPGATESRVIAVDLFCGAGGLSHGLQKAGVTVVADGNVDASLVREFAKLYEFKVPNY